MSYKGKEFTEPNWGSFQMLFLWISFSQIFFFPTFCISNDVNVKCFLRVHQVPEALFINFFSVCFLSVVQIGYILLSFMFTNSFVLSILLLSPSNVFFKSQLYFSLLKCPIWFFFMFPISLLRLFFPLFQVCW